MSVEEVKRYFNEYVFGLIRKDIQREIDLARAGKGGGNFLSALGLLCYTEFMGTMLLKGKGTGRERFDAFFREMGEAYRQLIDKRNLNVYHKFRGGMAHVYFVTNCDIAMLNNNYPAGIIIKPDGKYLFIVEKYFEDFMDACKRLVNNMVTDQNPYLPST